MYSLHTSTVVLYYSYKDTPPYLNKCAFKESVRVIWFE